MHEQFGVRFAGGQDQLSGKVIRIGHMGGIRERDLAMAIGALEQALASIGHRVEPGAGLAAHQRSLVGGQ